MRVERAEGERRAGDADLRVGDDGPALSGAHASERGVEPRLQARIETATDLVPVVRKDDGAAAIEELRRNGVVDREVERHIAPQLLLLVGRESTEEHVVLEDGAEV